MFLLVITVRLEPDDARPGAGPPAAAHRASAAADAVVAELAAQPQTRRLRWARSTEDQNVRVLVAEFDSAADYRAATAPMAVRTTLIPWLSGASDPTVTATGAVYEVVAVGDDGVLTPLETIVSAPGDAAPGT